MRIGVTGAAGFIGGWLVPCLESRGHEVTGCDRVEGAYVHDTFDLAGRGAARDWMATYSLDAVVHLAAQVGRVLGEDDLSRTVRDNAEVTTLVAAAAAELRVRAAYASTSEVYGDHGEAPVDEDAPWRLPYNLYGLTKRWGEEALALYAPEGLTVCRLSMPYGPGAPPGRGRRAMDNLLWQAHHRMPMAVHRGAERSWCWAGDTVRGIAMALEHPTGGTYNIGRDDDPRTMAEIAQLACKMTGAPEHLIQMVDPPAGQVVVKRLCTDRIRALGWRPVIEVEDGMSAVLEWVSEFDRDGRRL